MAPVLGEEKKPARASLKGVVTREIKITGIIQLAVSFSLSL